MRKHFILWGVSFFVQYVLSVYKKAPFDTLDGVRFFAFLYQIFIIDLYPILEQQTIRLIRKSADSYLERIVCR